MKFSMTGKEENDLYIQVTTTWPGFTVIWYIYNLLVDDVVRIMSSFRLLVDLLLLAIVSSIIIL